MRKFVGLGLQEDRIVDGIWASSTFSGLGACVEVCVVVGVEVVAAEGVVCDELERLAV